MNATITIMLPDIGGLTATAAFLDPAARTRVDFDPRLSPWFENRWTTFAEFEGVMRRAAIALNGRISATYEGSSVQAARPR